jgi:hypothetical protein
VGGWGGAAVSPTPEQIAAMEARGWTWEHIGGGLHMFKARARPICLVLSVWWDANTMRGWQWNSSLAWALTPPKPDPLTAADEAEAWLRGVLSGLRFPWLTVT